LLMIPPFFSGTISVLNTRNRGAVLQMNIFGELMWKWLVEGGKPPFPPFHPGEQPARSGKKQD
jgi:hypothetical protein